MRANPEQASKSDVEKSLFCSRTQVDTDCLSAQTFRMNRRDLIRGSIVCTLLIPETLRSSIAMDAQQGDAAAIYSVLLSRTGRWLDPGERIGLNLKTFAAKPPLLLIGSEKEPTHTGPPRPSITVPPEFVSTLTRMAADLVAMSSPVPLPPDLTLPATCLPMTSEDIRYFEELQPSGATYNVANPPAKPAIPSVVAARLRKVRSVVSYSGIAFSPDRSLALLAITDDGGSWSESYAVLGKANSTWHELDWEMTSVHTVS